MKIVDRIFMINFNNKINTKEGGRKYFVTSDLHFYHKNILNFCKDTRPFESVEDMNKALVEEWNSIVQEGDVVFHLGDFSFAGKDKTELILNQLKGTIIFILGNHDKTLRTQLNGLNTYDYLELRVDGVKVVMSHYPLSCWNQQHRGSVHLYGHCHGSYKQKGRCVDIGYDNLGGIKPLSDVIDLCLNEEVYTPDYH